MLQKIRDNSQGLISKVILGLMIVLFGLWGIDTLVGSFLVSTPTLTVNGDEIQTAEIDNLTQQKVQEVLSQLGDNPDLSQLNEVALREAAVNEVIQRTLIGQSATETGMTVSNATIQKGLRENPDFQIDGKYDQEVANRVIRGAGYTVSGYFNVVRQSMVQNQLLAAYTATGFATNDQMTQLASLVHQKRNLRYVVVQAAPFIDSVAVSAEEIKAYYDSHQNDFAQEEQVKVDYLELNKATMMNEVSVTEEQIQTAYQDEVASYQAQTERRASHILWEATTVDEIAAARTEAEAVKARLAAGEEFAALAAEFSDDTGSKQAGGDVGFTAGSNFVEPFENALKALAVNQVSDPVQTEFGIHLIKLTEQQETAVEPLEARRSAIEQDLKQKAVDTLFSARVEELKNLAFESPDLEGPATALKLTKQSSEFFTRTNGFGIAEQAAVRDAAFNIEVLEQELNSEVIAVDADRSVVLRVLEHTEAQIRPLDVVNGEVELLVRQEKAKQQAEALGKTFIDGLQTNGNIDGLLSTQGLSWNQVDSIERVAANVNPELTDKAFAMARPEVGKTTVDGFSLGNGDYAIIEVQSVTDGTAADFKEGEEASIRNFVSQQSGSTDITSFIRSLEARAAIEGKETQLEVQDPLL